MMQRFSGARFVIALVTFQSLLYLGCGHGEGPPKLDDASTIFLEARRSLAAGDRTKAMELLNQSIESTPYAWNHYERAKLHAEDGNDQAAQADVTAGLAIDPLFEDLIWLQEELKKPKEQRFKVEPPSALH